MPPDFPTLETARTKLQIAACLYKRQLVWRDIETWLLPAVREAYRTAFGQHEADLVDAAVSKLGLELLTAKLGSFTKVRDPSTSLLHPRAHDHLAKMILDDKWPLADAKTSLKQDG